MKCNVGKTDRILRIIAGIAIFALGFYYSSWWGLVGIVPLLTGLIRWCPLYIPFNINTGK
jgi:sulfite exporter TauE/SafE